jgi:hypothetical protein
MTQPDLSNFDTEAFLSMSTTEVFKKRPPIPTDVLYPAEIKSLTTRKWRSQDKYNEDGTLKQGISLDIELELTIPADVATRLGLTMTKLRLTHGVGLDLTATNGLDGTPGKNSGLRQYREALNLNRPGDPFSPQMLVGGRLSVRVRHEEFPLGSGNIQEKVAGVAKLV